jgi:hypothetical protein
MPDSPPRPKFGYDRVTEEEKALKATTPTGNAADAAPAGSALETANDASLAFIDKLTLGGAPWLRDKIADLAGVNQPKTGDMLAAAEARSPVATTLGATAGTLGPMALAGAGAGALGLRGALQGAAAAGGANVADQGVRALTEDRPFNPQEAAVTTAVGGIAPVVGPALKVAGRVAEHLPGVGTLGRIVRMARDLAPEATASAEETLGKNGLFGLRGGDPIKRTFSGAMERPPPGPVAPQATAPEPLGGYAPDDALGGIARMAREQARLRRISDPNWTPGGAGGTGAAPRVAPQRRLTDVLQDAAPPSTPPPSPPPGLIGSTAQQVPGQLRLESLKTLTGERQKRRKPRP